MGPSFEEVSYCQTMTMTTMVGKPNYKTQSHNPDNGLSIFQVHCGGGCEREQWGVNGQFYYCQPSPASSTALVPVFLVSVVCKWSFFLEILILLQFVLSITLFMFIYLWSVEKGISYSPWCQVVIPSGLCMPWRQLCWTLQALSCQ